MNTHNFTVSILSAALVLGASSAQADHPDSDNVQIRARVISASPIYRTINEPHKECWTETVDHRDHDYESRDYRNHNTGATIIGALAGGLLGSTVGKGNGKVAAAAVGAATGAVVGSRWNNGDRYQSPPQQVERCRTTDHVRQVADGYDVRYRFEGREFQTHLPYHPGKWINLDANLRVAKYQEDEGNYSNRGWWNDNNSGQWNNRGRWNDNNPGQWNTSSRNRWNERQWNDY